MANVFDFRSGHSIRGVNPQQIGIELERIRSAKGKLRPEDVIEEAKDAASPMHNAFEWDDSEAAHQHRLNQARRLIVSVKIVNGPVQTSVPAYMSVRTADHGRDYVPTVEAMTDDELRARALSELRQFIEGLERRYANFVEVASLLSNLKKQAG